MTSRSNSDGGRNLGFPTLQLVPSATPTLSRGAGQRVIGMLVSDQHIKNNVVQNVLKNNVVQNVHNGHVRITKVNDTTMMFDFESSRDRDQIMELSSWSVHGHCLNLKMCPAYMSVQDIDFGKVQVWAQVHDLSLEMFNHQNAQSIGDSIGKCLVVEEVQIMQQRTYLRIQVNIDISEPLLPGFRWVDSRGQEKWASI